VTTPVRVRRAETADLPAVAALHAARIDEGFLSSLGPAFLRRLYRRVLRRADGFVLVATDTTAAPDATVLGFVAGVGSVGRLYRSFVLRDGVVAGMLAAPKLAGAVPRVLETLRYPAAMGELPDAEILAVAVAASATGRGVGRALVAAATAEFDRRGTAAAKVVTTDDNAAALAMYRACGFVGTAAVEVHSGRASEVLVWTRS
jgi:ribosomal protein S18 acetylase RimI-like enzyme